ncbi:7616_t:CDS:2 [Ambispora leptoticha]|uniref:7616_t:CDS:1 n=1 Tax=Ambispora leptoticha TaxID=144679 RepID=A0A9N8W4W1_9GLOM|nr:7616_t:CDS:2 [Ambispora leptoticha]
MSPIQPSSFGKVLRACGTPNADNQQTKENNIDLRGQAQSNEFINSIQTSLDGIEHKLEILLKTSRINAQAMLTCNNTKLSELSTDNLVTLVKNLSNNIPLYSYYISNCNNEKHHLLIESREQPYRHTKQKLERDIVEEFSTRLCILDAVLAKDIALCV